MARTDPRTELILAAERLMAESGLQAPSLREIAEAAGNTNNSAVRYHFGDRRGLVVAVFAHRMAPIEVRRSALVDELLGADRLDVPSLVEAFVVPYAEAVDLERGSTWYGRFTAQAFGDLAVDVLADATGLPCAALRRTVTLLRPRLDAPDDATASTRLELMALLVTHALADRERQLAEGRDVVGTAETFVAELTRAAVAVLTAPHPSR
jgi:AcrR family transcriptional regulator